MFFEECRNCKKPLTNEANLRKLRIMFIGTPIIGGIFGAYLLPILGFGSSGVIGGSVAASWQSSIGSVAAGSLFATLQSLGATGVGTLLFGSVGAALGLLISIAEYIGWCTCNKNVKKKTHTAPKDDENSDSSEYQGILYSHTKSILIVKPNKRKT
ncbi:interferon alpha-inducible protein 27-like protein 2B [Monomorium pharaonis]|uniref:interferon alpha-inducible protein 27-like protein 2B n=1 Tax=Monomorium pharaonis TaxID=307658 RepID=UPI0017475AAC|nr:interferon alpha-inducible protein 27-like protein 2B [Monomorium pharaonis]